MFKRGRAGKQWKRGRGHSRPISDAERRQDELDCEQQTKRWESLAPKLGWCSGCGAHVDEANGKLHDEGCLLDESRCKKGQRT